MKIFFDSSAFVKRYILESGSDEIDILAAQASELGLCVISIPEIISAFCRLKREKKITNAIYGNLKRAFFNDIEDAVISQLSPETLNIAYQLLEHNTLRTLDALHVASAYIWGCNLFVSADNKQLQAAKLSLNLKIKHI